MKTIENNRINNLFRQASQRGAKVLVPFLTAGYPDLATTGAILSQIASRGIGICELGFPFSDPIADGPVIQNSYTQALEGGVTVDGIFQMVRKFRQETADDPAANRMALVAMVSYSIVFRRGPEKFIAQAAKAGFDGLVIPDLPLDEAGQFEKLASSGGLCNVLLISPTTPTDRQEKIAAHSRGFIYFMSIAGVTGERTGLPHETIKAVAALRKRTSTPICIGFGISTPQMVDVVCKAADGAIVGSAIVRKIADAVTAGKDRAAVAKAGADFICSLAAIT